MDKDLTKRVKFDILRYANCWEDAEILIQGLQPQEGSKILSIGSAGDNSFSLLTTNPELVVAVDINKIQLHLIELKRSCIKNFLRKDTLSFLGFLPSDEREAQFNSIKNDLTDEAKSYWETHIEMIRAGVIHQGKFEKYFQLFSQKVLPWIHSKATIEKLLNVKSGEEQIYFYNSHWNTRRWRLLFRIFFSKYLMGKLGRDPEFLKEVRGSVSELIFEKAAQHLQSELAQQNFILRYNLTGNFGSLLPHYLHEKNYEPVKQNIGKLVLKEGFAQDAVSTFGKFDYMNLSNIFEYMDDEQFRLTAEQLVNGTNKNGKIAYWNLMVPRQISSILPDKAVYQQELSKKLTASDRGFFYKNFIIDSIG